MYRWGEIARREPLWATTGGGSAHRRPGRPVKLNPEVVGRFFTAIRAGNYRETAARLAGIGPATMYRWMHDPRPEYAAFRIALLMCEVEVIGNLARLSRKSTKAGAFLLERRWPERWARPGRRRRPAKAARPDRPSLSDTALRDGERYPEIAARLYANMNALRTLVERVMGVA